MNHGTKVQLLADPNGDLTISNDEGSITIRANGDISISTLASIELSGETLGKLDRIWSEGGNPQPFVNALRARGKKS